MPDRLCLLSVHAHPDDEASKGAPTVARYHAEGVHTVLVCCTGGEEGDILNPAMDTPEVRADIGRVRMAELQGVHRDHRLRRDGPARLPGLGHARHGGQQEPGLLRPGPARRGGRAPGRRHPPRAPPGHRHLRRRPDASYPHPDHLRVHEISVLAFDSAGDPDRFPEAGPPFAPAKLYYSVWSGDRFRADPREVRGARARVTLRREVAGAHDHDRALHDDDRHRRASPTCGPRR